MSSDDTSFVGKIEGEDNLYGIFHVMGDAPAPRTKDRATRLFSHPIAAILEAYRDEHKAIYPTEFGVFVSPKVLEDCKDYYTGWEVKK